MKLPSKSQLLPKKAVIYCRVSSTKQVAEGHGLDSQESRCREYAKARSYDVVQVFPEAGVSGGDVERPAFMAMLAYLKSEAGDNGMTVLIDDLNRFSRDVKVHWQLRAMIAEAGGHLKSPYMEFGERADDVLVENLLASVSQHQREKNTEQVKDRMQARAKAGYWLFGPPAGYTYANVDGHGKLLVRKEPLSSIIQEALEGFASGRFRSPAEVKRFLESQPDFPKCTKEGEVRFQRIERMLTRPQYAGYIEVKKWGIPLRKGHHEGLISFEAWQKIQSRLKKSANAPARPDLSEDFPLRGFAICAGCGNGLTASWSRSRTGARHGYYRCYTKGCPTGRPSIRKADIETAIGEVIKSITPPADILALAKAMFKDAWSQRAAQIKEAASTLKRQSADTERQIASLLDKLVDASSPRVIKAYEERIEKLEHEKLAIAEKLENLGKPQRPFSELFEPAWAFLSNPYKYWEKGDITMRRMALRLAFEERIAYCREKGVRTAKTALPFKALEAISSGGKDLVEPRGVEPLTS